MCVVVALTTSILISYIRRGLKRPSTTKGLSNACNICFPDRGANNRVRFAPVNGRSSSNGRIASCAISVRVGHLGKRNRVIIPVIVAPSSKVFARSRIGFNRKRAGTAFRLALSPRTRLKGACSYDVDIRSPTCICTCDRCSTNVSLSTVIIR